MCIDFAAPLSEQEGCPMAVDSDAYKCSMFLWNALQVGPISLSAHLKTYANCFTYVSTCFTFRVSFAHIFHRLLRAGRSEGTRADSMI